MREPNVGARAIALTYVEFRHVGLAAATVRALVATIPTVSHMFVCS